MTLFWPRLSAFFARFKGNSDLGFIFGLFAAIFLLVVPIHKDLLSLLLF